jgi:hypothetical protein
LYIPCNGLVLSEITWNYFHHVYSYISKCNGFNNHLPKVHIVKTWSWGRRYWEVVEHFRGGPIRTSLGIGAFLHRGLCDLHPFTFLFYFLAHKVSGFPLPCTSAMMCYFCQRPKLIKSLNLRLKLPKPWTETNHFPFIS